MIPTPRAWPCATIWRVRRDALRKASARRQVLHPAFWPGVAEHVPEHSNASEKSRSDCVKCQMQQGDAMAVFQKSRMAVAASAAPVIAASTAGMAQTYPKLAHF